MHIYKTLLQESSQVVKTLKQKLDNNQEANIELYKDRRENIITSEDYKIFYNSLL